jgi:RNA polymerase sigma-70 factor (ECF subfamily)
MAHRRAVDRVRSAERALRRDALAAVDDPPEPDPSDLAVLHDECRRAREAVEELSTPQRQVIELAYFQGRTHREVAALLDIPLGTAKTRIREALRHLRGHMEEAT